MDNLATIEVITFNGCDTAKTLIDELEELKEKEEFELTVTLVPSAEDAETMHLYGSPTVVVNGVEYQKIKGGNPGFY